VQWRFPNVAVARAQAGAARADDDAARAAFDARVLRALRETEQALARYGATWREHDALLAARDGHALAFALAQREYRAGVLEPQALLDAERDAAAADAALARSAQRLCLDQVAVFKALGGGWQR
jgi:outer membrane protein TolC